VSAVKQEQKCLAHAIQEYCGCNVFVCYQCGRCSAGCPVAFAFDWQPRQLIRLIQLDRWADVLAAHTPWLCASCLTCAARCPQGLDVAKVMDAIRMLVRQEGCPIPEPVVEAFHTTFLDMIRQRGRQHELSLMARFKLRGGGLGKDVPLGVRMLGKGKLRLSGQRAGQGGVLARIFAQAGGKPK
jgi:heterodisulfide reductase subunit C